MGICADISFISFISLGVKPLKDGLPKERNCEDPGGEGGCATPRREFSWCTAWLVISFCGSCELRLNEDCLVLAPAIAAANVETLGYLALGSFAIARKITSESPDGTMELIKAGGVGSKFICCDMIAAELSPRKGTVPVYVS